MKKRRVQLVRKLADVIDGVDLSGYSVGDTIALSPNEARLLIAEHWAVSAERRTPQQRAGKEKAKEDEDVERPKTPRSF
jgi:hypothetical protein